MPHAKSPFLSLKGSLVLAVPTMDTLSDESGLTIWVVLYTSPVMVSPGMYVSPSRWIPNSGLDLGRFPRHDIFSCILALADTKETVVTSVYIYAFAF